MRGQAADARRSHAPSINHIVSFDLTRDRTQGTKTMTYLNNAILRAVSAVGNTTLASLLALTTGYFIYRL